MSRLSTMVAIVFCVVLIGLPLWAGWAGTGVNEAKAAKRESGNVRHVYSRSVTGGGPSIGK